MRYESLPGLLCLCVLLTACSNTSTQANLSPDAAYTLGMRYFSGQQVPQDMTKAAELLSQAAEPEKYHKNSLFGSLLGNTTPTPKGNRDAQRTLGLLSYLGQGVEKDDTRAAELYRKAAMQGDGASQAALGMAYERGFGVTKSLPSAYAWYKISVDENRNIDGKLGLVRIAPKMTDDERKAGEQLFASIRSSIQL